MTARAWPINSAPTGPEAPGGQGAFAGGGREARPGHGSGAGGAHVFTVLLFLLFCAALLTVLVVGTNVYRSLAAATDATDTARMQGTLIANAVRAHDAASAARVDVSPGGGPMLVLAEHLDSGEYEMRLYLQDGWIVEEYAPAGTAAGSVSATQLVASDTFDVSWEGNALLAITTDAGVTYVAPRSDGARVINETAGVDGSAADGSSPGGSADAGAAANSNAPAAEDRAEGGARAWRS